MAMMTRIAMEEGRGGVGGKGDNDCNEMEKGWWWRQRQWQRQWKVVVVRRWCGGAVVTMVAMVTIIAVVTMIAMERNSDGSTMVVVGHHTMLPVTTVDTWMQYKGSNPFTIDVVAVHGCIRGRQRRVWCAVLVSDCEIVVVQMHRRRGGMLQVPFAVRQLHDMCKESRRVGKLNMVRRDTTCKKYV